MQKTNNKGVTFTDKKKITISTSTKKNKTYRTYQININNDYIRMLNNDNIENDINNKRIKLYLTEKHKQYYQIKTKANTIDKTIETQININNRKTTSPLTLPKNDMEYIKAYDTYLDKLNNINETIDITNKEFKPAPLTATILLKFNVNETDNNLNVELNITNLITNIDDEFIKYIKQEYNDIIPEWLNTLLTDWNDEYLTRILNIS